MRQGFFRLGWGSMLIYWLLQIGCQPVPPAFSVADWPVYQGPGANQYSRLTDISLDNVGQLELAWEYRSGDAAENNLSQIQCNPLIINGIVYASTPALTFIALDGRDGREIWSFDPFAETAYEANGMGVNRGVSYWSDGKTARILCTAGSYLYAVDAQSGQPDPAFGAGASIFT